MRPCECCQNTRNWPGTIAAKQYQENCLWCGARYIQRIPKFGMVDGRPLTRDESIAERRRVLEIWVKWGHSELEIRRLAKLDALPLEPELSTSLSTGRANRWA